MIFFGWLVFLSDAVFYGVMVFGGFLVWVVFGLGMVSTFGGLVSVPFLLVSVPFSVPLDAVGCCFYIGALVGLVVWFLWRFLVFVEFCQFVPFQFCDF